MNRYRTGRKLRTTIYRGDEEQPCAWVPDDPVLADRIVGLLNTHEAYDGDEVLILPHELAVETHDDGSGERAVKLTHLPTGRVAWGSGRSDLSAKAAALVTLRRDLADPT